MKVSFITLGCKVNIYESNALMNMFENEGFEVVEPSEASDIFIINTCAVTNMADAKSRKMIHKARRLNPNAIVVAIGCYIQTSKDALNIEGVDFFLGNGNKLSVIELVKSKLAKKEEEKNHILDIMKATNYEPLEVTTFDHTRAFIKIQDGCNNFCSYCIIPYARGPIRCKNKDNIIAELFRITEMGYEEVVLAGIHTGRYQDGETKLADLIKEILSKVPKIKRLRLSSIEINEIDDDILALMKENSVLADHLHLPLQSGCDKILNLMNRKYDTAYFLSKIDKIRQVRPDISITTDVIVGFPCETNEDFEETRAFIEKVDFSALHVFPYSKRNGTKASAMPQVQDKVKKTRTLQLIALSKKLQEKYEKKFIGRNVEVIFEEEQQHDTMVGHSSNYLRVFVKKDMNCLKKCTLVKIDKVDSNGIFGEIIPIMKKNEKN